MSTERRPPCNLRFADDIDLPGSSEEELQQLTRRLEETAAEYGMEISSGKILVNSIEPRPPTNIQIKHGRYKRKRKGTPSIEWAISPEWLERMSGFSPLESREGNHGRIAPMDPPLGVLKSTAFAFEHIAFRVVPRSVFVPALTQRNCSCKSGRLIYTSTQQLTENKLQFCVSLPLTYISHIVCLFACFYSRDRILIIAVRGGGAV